MARPGAAQACSAYPEHLVSNDWIQISHPFCFKRKACEVVGFRKNFGGVFYASLASPAPAPAPTSLPYIRLKNIRYVLGPKKGPRSMNWL